MQGLASSFSWTGSLSWLVAAAPRARKGQLIGQAFAAAVAGALLGPVLGGLATVVGTGWAFGAVAVASLGLAVWALLTPATPPGEPQPLSMLGAALRDRRVLLSVWFVLLPALLFGALGVLGPLRLSDLGVGAIGIGAVWLVGRPPRDALNLVIGRFSDRFGPLVPIRAALIASIVAPRPALAREPLRPRGLILVAAIGFGTFYTPGMAMLTHAAEARGLDYGYAFALLNLAWAPGQTAAPRSAASLAEATSDAVPYLFSRASRSLTLLALRPLRTLRSESPRPPASGSVRGIDASMPAYLELERALRGGDLDAARWPSAIRPDSPTSGSRTRPVALPARPLAVARSDHPRAARARCRSQLRGERRLSGARRGPSRYARTGTPCWSFCWPAVPMSGGAVSTIGHRSTPLRAVTTQSLSACCSAAEQSVPTPGSTTTRRRSSSPFVPDTRRPLRHSRP